MHRKFLAIFMTVCLVAALFAGCGGKDKDDPSLNQAGDQLPLSAGKRYGGGRKCRHPG